MNGNNTAPRRMTAVHALAAIALVAVGWYCYDRAIQTCATAPGNDKAARCMYQVVLNGQCIGVAFFDGPQTVQEVLTATKVQCGTNAGAHAVLPCNRVLRIDDQRPGIEIETIRGTALLAAGHRIDINAASAVDLEAVPGIGPKLATNIINARETCGTFIGVQDLQKVPGIGKKKLAQIMPFLDARPVMSHPGVGALPIRLAFP